MTALSGPGRRRLHQVANFLLTTETATAHHVSAGCGISLNNANVALHRLVRLGWAMRRAPGLYFHTGVNS